MRSNFEKTVASEIMLAGVTYEYEPFQLEYYSKQRSCVCEDCGCTIVYKRRWYTPDFWIPKHDLVIEAKGKFTAANRAKMLDVIRDWPDIEFVMWFMANNKINKASTTRYTDWCDSNGIKYHVGKEAPEWLSKLT